ncbi:MAG: hypothetical protein CMN72_00290 [Sphingomonas sp.]|nr:hypothetical protein [Sphingomonas sp.]
MKLDEFILVYIVGAIFVVPFLIGVFLTRTGIIPDLFTFRTETDEHFLISFIGPIILYFFANELSVSLNTKRVIYYYDSEGTPYLKRSIYRTLLFIHIVAVFLIPYLFQLLQNIS